MPTVAIVKPITGTKRGYTPALAVGSRHPRLLGTECGPWGIPSTPAAVLMLLPSLLFDSGCKSDLQNHGREKVMTVRGMVLHEIKTIEKSTATPLKVPQLCPQDLCKVLD